MAPFEAGNHGAGGGDLSRTYGKLLYDENARMWGIEDLEPHAAIKFKRMFPRIAQGLGGLLCVSDTRDMCADLNWFMQRFPLRAAPDYLRRLSEGEAAMHRLQAEAGRILLPDWKPTGHHGFREGEAPWRFQQRAASLGLCYGRLLLLDDVGLGKTISALAALTSKGAPLPAAVVVQAHLAEQWVEEYVEPFTHLRAHVIKGTKPYDLPEADIYIFRYSNIAGWVDVAATGMFRSFIMDEVQEYRHGRGTNKGQAGSMFANLAEFRMGLTATPVYNYGAEMWNVMNFIEPGALGSWEEFAIEWCDIGGKTVNDPDALGAYLADQNLTLRRTEDDEEVGKEMPPLNTLPVEIPYDADVEEDARTLMVALAQQVLRGSFTERGQAARELDMKLRQVTGVAKARHVAAYVEMLLQETEKVLVGVWHRDVYDILMARLARYDPVMYSGSESPGRKRKSKRAFVEGSSRVMLISLRSGAGLDKLQHVCSDLVLGELDWSPQVHKQLAGRLRRWGQEKAVTMHVLHADGGSDPAMIELLGVKTDQARGIVDPGKSLAPVTRDESRIKKLAEMYLARAT